MTAVQDPMPSSSATRIDALIKDRSTLLALRSLALQLQRRQVAGPSHVAAITAKTLRSVVSTTKFQNVEDLVQVIRAAGGFLQEAQPGGV
jgi:translation initiation factor eIF-2B subunit beta